METGVGRQKALNDESGSGRLGVAAWCCSVVELRGEGTQWAHLERGAGRVVDVGQHFHRLLEHDAEGASRAVTAEACVILAQDRVAVRVDDLGGRRGPCTTHSELRPAPGL